MSKTPIMEYKTDEELQESLKEWQTRLFLTDWNIKVRICSKLDMADIENAGECTVYHANHVVRIDIAKATEIGNVIEKVPQEKTLVHELLHCKYIRPENDSFETTYVSIREHGLLEQMAKSLIMAKYDIPYEWFFDR